MNISFHTDGARVDAHQHFWRPARGDYGWLRADVPALAPLCRDVLPGELQPLLQRHGVLRTVLVQAADSTAETDFMLELAARTDFVAGVVGWVDLSRADAVATLERWRADPKFKGVRPMLQDLADDDWIASTPHPAPVAALARLGLRFDALVKPRHLPALQRFVQAHPDLPVVIDHAAKPQLADGRNAAWADGWRAQMAQLASQPQVMCKLSGLLTEASPAQRATTAQCIAAVRPVWEHLLECFGPRRLMWGSDWPVLTLAADYATWAEVSGALIGELSPEEQAQVWQGSAERFYALAAEPHA